MTLFAREKALILASPALFAAPFIFYLMMMLLLPMLVQLPVAAMKQLVSTLIWFALSISFLSLLPHLFKEDGASGVLDQIYTMQKGLQQYVQVKLITVWGIVFFPMIAALPLFAVIYGFTIHELIVLACAIASGGLLMTSLGLLLMVIAMGIESQQAIIALMYIPLVMPVIIIGTLCLNPLFEAASLSLLAGGACIVSVFVCPCCNYFMKVMLYE